jgi:hypothetical protein
VVRAKAATLSAGARRLDSIETPIQSSTRRAIERTKRGGGSMMSSPQINEVFSQITGRNAEMVSLWAEANEKVLRDLVNFSASTAKEGVRLYAEIQLAAVEAAKDAQAFLLRRQAAVRDAVKDPVSWYHDSLVESAEGAQRAFKLFEGSAQAVARSSERLQTTAEQTAKEIQASFVHFADEVKSLSSPVVPQAKARGQKVEA